jgi:alpha-ketoglutarate-dependent sulfate ester dioxygenase
MTSPTAMVIRPLSAVTGAQITGVDLSVHLDEATIAGIREALLRWKVVFFRDQNLDHDSQLAFAARFGEVTPAHPLFDSAKEDGRIYAVERERPSQHRQGPSYQGPFTGWHSDATAVLNPPWASILRADVIPPYGGDTMWTNLVAAYGDLSGPLRDLADRLRARHRFGGSRGSLGISTNAYQERLEENPMITDHPIVRVHPETGERALYVSPNYIEGIVGLTPRESEKVLDLLWEHITQPRYTVRFHWEPGSVAFWDNRATCHLALDDIDRLAFPRRLYRVTLVGDIPVGVDGQPSRAVAGAVFAAASESTR